jgi:ubiquinone/menaquinone biosynthesis C-methylase UbiE
MLLQKLKAKLLLPRSSGERPHYVEGYGHYVDYLLRTKPRDEAMSIAVGGDYEATGEREADVLQHYGLRDGMSLIDLGCGSGRLAHAISKRISIDYLGSDVVPKLLDYARTKAPPSYRFELNHALSLPCTNQSVDFAAAFSVFTHLLHAESYLYLEDLHRALKPGATLVFSFLEFSDPAHWFAFDGDVQNRRNHFAFPMNTLIERSVIPIWAQKLGFTVEAIVGGNECPWQTSPFGRAVAVLRS